MATFFSEELNVSKNFPLSFLFSSCFASDIDTLPSLFKWFHSLKFFGPLYGKIPLAKYAKKHK